MLYVVKKSIMKEHNIVVVRYQIASIRSMIPEPVEEIRLNK